MELFDQISLMQSNRHYRFGDLIYRRGLRWEQDRRVIMSGALYDGSILKNYLLNSHVQSRLNCPVGKEEWSTDSICLRDAVLEKTDGLSLCDNTLYVNIRLGDVIMEPSGKINGPNTYAKKFGLFVAFPQKMIDEIAAKLDSCPEINSIEFVTALHFGDNEQTNDWRFSQEAFYENKKIMENLFNVIREKFGLPISITSNSDRRIENVDRHLALLSCAKHVVLDQGGFATVASLVRQFICDPPYPQPIENYNIMSCSNFEYRKIALNWALGLKRLGIENYNIYSSDQDCYNFLKNNNVNTILKSGDICFEPYRYKIIHELLSQGLNVIYSDLDAIWLRSPGPALADYDMHFSLGSWPKDIHDKWGFAVCTGWIALKSTSANFIRKFIDCHAQFDDPSDGGGGWLKDPRAIDDQARFNRYIDSVGLRRSQLKNVSPRDSLSLRIKELRAVGLAQGAVLRARNNRPCRICHPKSPKDPIEKERSLRLQRLWFVKDD